MPRDGQGQQAGKRAEADRSVREAPLQVDDEGAGRAKRPLRDRHYWLLTTASISGEERATASSTVISMKFALPGC